MPTSVESCRVLLLYDTLMYPNPGGLDNFRETRAPTFGQMIAMSCHIAKSATWELVIVLSE